MQQIHCASAETINKIELVELAIIIAKGTTMREINKYLLFSCCVLFSIVAMVAIFCWHKCSRTLVKRARYNTFFYPITKSCFIFSRNGKGGNAHNGKHISLFGQQLVQKIVSTNKIDTSENLSIHLFASTACSLFNLDIRIQLFYQHQTTKFLIFYYYVLKWSPFSS